MGKIILPRGFTTTPPADLLNPADRYFTGLWGAPYTSSPVAGIASLGPSGGRDASEATNPPTVGPNLKGIATLHLDGVNDILTPVFGPNKTAEYISSSGTGCGFFLVKPLSATTAIGNVIGDVALMSDEDGVFGVTYTNEGFGVYLQTAVGLKYNVIPCAPNEWHLVTYSIDFLQIRIGIDGPPTTALDITHPHSLDDYVNLRTFHFFRNYNGSKFFHGEAARWGITDIQLSDADFAGIFAFFNYVFDLGGSAGEEVDPVTPIDPSSEPLDGLWRDFSASPLVGSASAGASGGRDASEATNPPSVGVSLNSHTAASFDGSNDELTIAGHASDYMATDGTFFADFVGSMDTGGTWHLTEPYLDKGVLSDGGGTIGLTFSDKGFTAFRAAGGDGGWKTVSAKVPTATVFYATAAYDPSKNLLSVGVNGPPDHSIFCIPTDISLPARILSMGRNYDGGARAAYDQWHLSLRKTIPTNDDIAGVMASLNTRLGQSFSRASNVTPGSHAGTDSAPNSYVGTTKTVAAAFAQRDGAKLHFFDGKYRLLGGWRSAGYGPWSGEQTTNEIWSSTDLVTWTLDHAHDNAPPTSGAGARWTRRHTFGTAQPTTGPAAGMLVVVGSDQYVSGLPDVWTTDGTDNCGVWTRVCAAMPCGARAGLAVGAYGAEIHVIGGHPLDASVFYTAQAQHYKSADGGATWEQLPDCPFATAYITQLVEHDGLLFVCGGNGGTNASRIFQNFVWAWNGSKWRLQCEHAPWAGRMWVDPVAYDGKLWVIAGRDTDTTDCADAWYSRTAGRTWAKVNEAPWPATHADGVCATVADGIVMASGFATNQSVFTLKKV